VIRLASYTVPTDEFRAELAARGFKLERNNRDWSVVKGREFRATMLDINGMFSTTAIEMFWANQKRFWNEEEPA
jgi:hypothetical protein